MRHVRLVQAWLGDGEGEWGRPHGQTDLLLFPVISVIALSLLTATLAVRCFSVRCGLRPGVLR